MYGTTLYIFYSKFSTDMLCVDNLEYYLRFQFQIKKWHFKSAYWQEIKPEGRTLFVLCGFRFAHLLCITGRIYSSQHICSEMLSTQRPF